MFLSLNFLRVKEIESQSAYKRQPPPEKKYISVSEMGRLLGLKKTDRYWLVHKNFFKTEVILGKMRVELKSFEKWYGSQDDYHIVSDEMPETVKSEDNRRIEAYRRAVLERDGHSRHIGNDAYLTVNEAAVLAGVNPATVHKWIKKGKVEAVQSSKTIRIPRQEFEGWLQGREKVEV